MARKDALVATLSFGGPSPVGQVPPNNGFGMWVVEQIQIRSVFHCGSMSGRIFRKLNPWMEAHRARHLLCLRMDLHALIRLYSEIQITLRETHRHRPLS